MPTISREEASKIIGKIYAENRGLDAARVRSLEPEEQRTFKCLQERAGRTNKAFATELYTKATRFILELIQNADDNKYSAALQRGQAPQLTFTVHPDIMVIDCNENGFTTEDVHSICNLHQSQKKSRKSHALRDCIGEKGIGFKSVFAAAKKVHIQSGPFSFSFNHEADESGLWMTAPIDTPHSVLPSWVTTRMTLHYRDKSVYKQIVHEFENLPTAFLMFLRNIRTFTVRKVINNEASTCVHSYIFDDARSIGTLKKSINQRGTIYEHKDDFHIERNQVKKLPKDNARRNTSAAEIVLAFPLNKDQNPAVTERQYTFAFLPIQQYGFKFIIHSDFITKSDREGVTDSQWNSKLLKGVADTFVNAISGFNTHEQLQYSWVRYLPNDEISDPFWSRLQTMILKRLRERDVLRSWSGRSLKDPTTLRQVVASFKDRFGQPLLEDLSEELYLSDRYYEFASAAEMKRLGVREVQHSEIIARLASDIESPASRFKAQINNEDWQNRMAKLLSLLWSDKSNFSTLESLPIIPLSDGSWVPAKGNRLYFPTSTIDGMDIYIPIDQNFLLLDKHAVKSSDRVELFRDLGVKECNPRSVVSGILESKLITPSALKYLYYFLENPDTALGDRVAKRSFNLVCTESGEVPPMDMYLESSEEYSAQQLFGSDFQSKYLHGSYLAEVPRYSKHNDLTLQEWIMRVLKIPDHPRMILDGFRPDQPKCFTRGFRFITDHRAVKLLGTLKSHWCDYNKKISAIAVNYISTVEVPCTNQKSISLNKSFLPNQKLFDEALEYGVEEHMYFLKLPFATSHDVITAEWDFLQKFGVKTELDISFYISILENICGDDRIRQSISAVLVTKLYESIARHCKDEQDKHFIRHFFKSRNAIWIKPGVWAKPSECLWSAPYNLNTKYILSHNQNYLELLLQHLFCEILQCSKPTWEHSVDFLESLQNSLSNEMHDANKEILEKVYSHIEADIQGTKDLIRDSALIEIDKSKLRLLFEEKRLVYVPSLREWREPSSCLWVTNTHIAGKVALENQFEGLEKLFREFLSIKRPGIQILIEELQEISANAGGHYSSDSIEQARNLTLEINELGEDSQGLQPLKEIRFLPVQLPGGIETLCYPTDFSSFVIFDKHQHERTLRRMVGHLAFPLVRTRQLRHLISALELDHRYTSSLVAEATRVEGGTIDEVLTSHMRRRIYAILRCVAHFRSSSTNRDIRALYSILRNSLVFRSEHITKVMSLEQNTESVTAEAQRCNLHLEESDGGLNIFVPRNEYSREQCYMQQLPQKLVSYLGLNDATEPLLIRILTTRSEIAMEASLTEDGIGHVAEIADHERNPIKYVGELNAQQPYAESPGLGIPISKNPDVTSGNTDDRTPSRQRGALQQGEPEAMEIDSPLPDRANHPTTANNQLPTPPSAPTIRIRDIDISRNEDVTPHSISGGQVSRKRKRATSVIDVDAEDDNLSLGTPGVPIEAPYSQLLERITQVARCASLPSWTRNSSFTMTRDTFATILRLPCFNDPDFSCESACGDLTQNRSTWNRRLGAAGELYVFELLSKLDLRGFSIDNWQSKIRHEVRAHGAYKNIREWIGNSETADFTYTDTTGILTEMLRGLGHLGGFNRLSATPTYCIEVKTTFKGSDEPFYVSKGQYKRMQNFKVNPLSTNENVYLIFRVFNVGRHDTGLRIFADPAKLEEENVLEFAADSYRVSPVRKHSSGRSYR